MTSATASGDGLKYGARYGDARVLAVTDSGHDVVLLLGPLYHLPERPDRLPVLAEACRVVRPGGAVVAATINRFAGLHDVLREKRCFTPPHRERTDAVTVDGRHRHAEAGLTVGRQYGVEGVAWLMGVPRIGWTTRNAARPSSRRPAPGAPSPSRRCSEPAGICSRRVGGRVGRPRSVEGWPPARQGRLVR